MDRRVKKGLYLLLVGLCLLPILAGCAFLLDLFEPPGGTEDYGIVMGKVIDTADTALGGVTVTLAGQTTGTNDQGWFSISNVSAGDRVLLKFSKNGYATTYRVTEVQVGGSSFVEATMSTVGASQPISAASGGTTTTPDGGGLEIGANSLVNSQGNPFSGTANVTLTVFDPTDDREVNAFPGEYLGISAQGETVPLKSYGFMDISVTGSGDLQLAAGETATVKIPVPVSLQSEAESRGTCPLWYYDTETGYWREEGQGTYDPASGSFVGTVTHFSTWNYDVSFPRAYISGRVVDSCGNPIKGAKVNCWGPGWTYSRWASGETSTPADGSFNCVPVECTVVFNYQASKGEQKSPVYSFGPLPCDTGSLNNPDTCHWVGDLVLPGCAGGGPTVQLTLTWGANPSDLDSHLTWKHNSDTFHVYYTTKGSLSSEPYANLDTDDTTSYGPEVVTIAKLRPGTYRYSVRHYDGTGTIQTSGAEVNAVIEGIGIYKFTPPASQPGGTDIWRIVDIVVATNGEVTAVNPINDYVTGDDDSGLLYP